SVSLEVSNKAYCPVILIPRHTKWQVLQKIVFAGNYDSMTPQFVKEINSLAQQLSAGVIYLNVRNYDPILETKQKEIDWSKLTQEEESGLITEKATIYGNDTVEQLKKFAEEHTIHLMVFASKHRSFWENLTHTSISQN